MYLKKFSKQRLATKNWVHGLNLNSVTSFYREKIKFIIFPLITIVYYLSILIFIVFKIALVKSLFSWHILKLEMELYETVDNNLIKNYVLRG